MAADWYYTTNKQQMGPVSWDELRQLASSGLLRPADMVWTDGMPEWVKASRQDGLFAGAEGGTAKPEREPPRRRSRRREDDDEDGDRRSRDKPKKEGMAVGLKVGLILGGVLLLVLVLLCGGGTAIYFAVRNPGRPVAAGGQNLSYTVNLIPGGANERPVSVRQGQRVSIIVTSTVTIPNTDVDLAVQRGPNRIAGDLTVGPNCRVEFVAPATDMYRVRVNNRGPGVANSRVNITIQ
jgi:GYF domain 2